MSSRILIWILCAGALVLACGPHVRHNESAASTTDAPPQPSPSEASPRDGRTLATSANVSVKDGITLTLHVTNLAEHALELTFPNGQTHDFVVLDSAGREAWRWSSDRMFTQALQNRMLGAKQTMSYEERWDAGGRTGKFTAVATLRSSNHPVEERVEFSLP
jgi:hypothetical protein